MTRLCQNRPTGVCISVSREADWVIFTRLAFEVAPMATEICSFLTIYK